MHSWMVVAAYIAVGFTVASLMARFTDFTQSKGEPDEVPPVVIFLGMGAIWPIIVAFSLLAGPVALLKAYVELISKR